MTNAVKCLIVDDEDLARELIETHLSQLKGYQVVASCASAIEANVVLKEQRIDLMFLDIEMPVLKGTDFYKNLTQKPKVIFTTAYRDYAIDGFELNAVDYLLKPVVFARFFQAIERFQTLHVPSPRVENSNNEAAKGYIFVRKDRKQVKVELADILYVQGLKDYIQIHLESTSVVHIIKQGIGVFAKELGDDFIRVHRSYIVNRTKVSAFTRNDVEIGEIEIPIGESYRHDLSAFL